MSLSWLLSWYPSDTHWQHLVVAIPYAPHRSHCFHFTSWSRRSQTLCAEALLCSWWAARRAAHTVPPHSFVRSRSVPAEKTVFSVLRLPWWLAAKVIHIANLWNCCNSEHQEGSQLYKARQWRQHTLVTGPVHGCKPCIWNSLCSIPSHINICTYM